MKQKIKPIAQGIEALVDSRQPLYGSFKRRATLLVHLRFVLHNHLEGSAHTLSPVQTVALGEICNKISRIVNGDPNVVDSWRDIAGYATLVVNELNELNGENK
jgi:hypothetical protein